MRKTNYKLLLFIISILFSNLHYGQNLRTSSITTEDGLSQGMIFDILKDKDGFMWFATKNGLNRFDGYDFKVFTNNPFDTLSISDNVIWDIFEDSKERFWVGTRSNGLNYFDKETESFYPIKIAKDDDNYFDLTTQSINNIVEDVYGNFWIQTDEKLIILKITDFEKEVHSGFYIEAYPEIWKICLGKKGELWTSAEGKNVSKWQEAERKFIALPTFNNKIIKGVIFNLNPDPTGMWVVDDRTFYRIDEDKTEAYTLKNVAQEFPEIGRRRVNRFHYIPGLQAHVINFYFDNNYYLVDLKNAPDASKMKSILSFTESRYPTSSFFENGKVAWLGTNGYGIRKVLISPKTFRYFLPKKSIRNIHWLEGKGMVIYTNRQSYFLPNKSNETDLIKKQLNLPNETTGIISSQNGGYWLGYKFSLKETDPSRDGLVKLDKNLREEKRYQNLDIIHSDGFMQEDALGNVWLTPEKRDFAKLDIAKDSILYFSCQEFNETAIPVKAQCFYLDGQNNLWKGQQRGLMKLELDKNGKPVDCQFFQTNPKDKSSLRNNSVSSLLDDPTDPATYIWVGTKGGGLNKLNKKTGKFEHFTTEDGLPDNVVYGILADEENKLWLSTNKGLSQFDPVEKTFENYRAADGLQDDEFNSVSYCKNEDTGEFFFGGINGLTTFLPKNIKPNQRKPKIYITNFKIHNETVNVGKPLKERGENPLTKAIQFTEKIELAWHQNHLSFQFAALDYDVPEKNLYKFRLSGVNHDWVIADKSRIANFANLDIGEYVFEVMGSNSSGVWNENPTKLNITIHPPFWLTWWAYGGYFLTIGFTVFQIYRFQVNRAKLRNELLFEQKEAERLAEIDKIKTNFFTNITHEFRTPLTLILEPLRLAMKKRLDFDVQKQLSIVKTNADKLLRLVNQLLDISKIEDNKMSLDLRLGNPYESIRPIFQSFLVLAEKKGIKLKMNTDKSQNNIYFDKNKLEKIIYNLLSNAVKFTNEGQIELVLAMKERTAESEKTTKNSLSFSSKSFEQFGENYLSITVKDTGIGIPSTQLSSIFNRFHQVDSSDTRSHGGTGIGLALVKELVELMHGTISVESQLNNGTSFEIKLPAIQETTAAKKKALSKNEQLKQLKSSNELAQKNLTTLSLTEKFIDQDSENSKINPDDNRPVLLLVEDNAELRIFLKMSLKTNYKVIEAANGATGIKLAKQLIPDLIVSDVMMPEKDGFELANDLKQDQLTSHIPIILLTAKASIDNKIKGLKTGADAYLTKPFNTEELLVRIEKLIELRSKLQEKYQKGMISKDKRPTDGFSKIDHDFIRKISTFIHEGMNDPKFSIEYLASQMYISRSQLFRKIKALTGITVVQFVRNIRLDHARELLLNKEGNVGEVSLAVGFNDDRYFSTKFKERFGVLPSEI